MHSKFFIYAAYFLKLGVTIVLIVMHKENNYAA